MPPDAQTSSHRSHHQRFRHLGESVPTFRGRQRARSWNVWGARLSPSPIVPDDLGMIREKLLEHSDSDAIDLIVTTGGTGLAPRDVTPEATLEVIEKSVPGLPELMRMEGLKSNPRAALTRAVAGLRKKTLIINLPGSVRGVQESLAAVAPILGHALEVASGNTVRCGG